MEGLAFGLIHWLITGAVGGFCALVGWALWYLKDEIRSVQKTSSDDIQKVKDAYRELQLDLAKNYHGKEEIKEMLDKSLEPIYDALKELKEEVRGWRQGNRRSDG